MRVCLAIAAAMVLALTTVTPANAYSKAANYLIKEQIAAACGGRPGKIFSDGVIERDLTGDGRADLIINHDNIQCASKPTQSGFCGVMACSVYVYVREGALLKQKLDFLSIGVTVGRGKIPVLTFVPHGAKRQVRLRWNGHAFK